jgi:PiT family inorganic phosphate transporter
LALGILLSNVHNFNWYFAGAAIAHAGFNVVKLAHTWKEGGMPSEFQIIISFIVPALIGMLISYFMSLWLLYSSKKNIGQKIFTGCV